MTEQYDKVVENGVQMISLNNEGFTPHLHHKHAIDLGTLRTVGSYTQEDVDKINRGLMKLPPVKNPHEYSFDRALERVRNMCKDQYEIMIESDPNGKNAHETGSKLDAGKNRLGLVLLSFSRALKEVGEVGTYGANKYTPNGWIDVPNGVERYTDAMLRHLLAEHSGEAFDKDTDILHAAHTAWNALARLDLMLREKEYKDSLA